MRFKVEGAWPTNCSTLRQYTGSEVNWSQAITAHRERSVPGLGRRMSGTPMARDSWTLMVATLSLFPSPPRPENPPLEEQASAEDEPKIVPRAAVVDFVDIDVLAEHGNNEGDRGDESMPQPEPESRYLSLRISGLFDAVGSGSATRKRQEEKKTASQPSHFSHLTSSQAQPAAAPRGCAFFGPCACPAARRRPTFPRAIPQDMPEVKALSLWNILLFLRASGRQEISEGQSGMIAWRRPLEVNMRIFGRALSQGSYIIESGGARTAYTVEKRKTGFKVTGKAQGRLGRIEVFRGRAPREFLLNNWQSWGPFQKMRPGERHPGIKEVMRTYSQYVFTPVPEVFSKGLVSDYFIAWPGHLMGFLRSRLAHPSFPPPGDGAGGYLEYFDTPFDEATPL